MAKPQNHNKPASPSHGETDQDLALAQARAEFEAAPGEAQSASGFPPYLKAFVGLVLDMQVLMIDERKENFIRHVCQYLGSTPLVCATGKVTDAEEVVVQKGELFTLSDYKGLPFEQLIGLPIKAACLETIALGPAADGKPRNPMYKFTFKFHDQARDKKIYEDRKTASIASIAEKNRLGAAASNGTVPAATGARQQALA